MPLLPLIAFSFLLSLVPFSVALSSSVYRCIVWKEALKIALAFAITQAAMAALGWSIGFAVRGLLHAMAVPVGVMIIFFIGLRLSLDSRRLGREHRTMAVENMRILMGFALVISINTALLGLGLGVLYPGIMTLAAFIFGMVFLMTITGVQAGKKGMMNLGRTAEMLSGGGLVVIAVIIMLQYLKIL